MVLVLAFHCLKLICTNRVEKQLNKIVNEINKKDKLVNVTELLVKSRLTYDKIKLVTI